MYSKNTKYVTEIAPATETRSEIWRSTMCIDGENVKCFYPEATTLYEIFSRGKGISPNGPCYGYRLIDAEGKAGDYEWVTYNEVWERVKNFASGLIALNLVPERHGLKCLGVFSRNRLEWCIAEQACNAYNLTLVPTYDTLGADSVLFILRETEMKTIVCSSLETVKILSITEKRIPLEVIIQMEDITEKDKELAKASNISIYSMREIEEKGKEKILDVTPPSPTDICTLCYTSGTTGSPKGVMISHQNLVASLAGCLCTGIAAHTTTRYLSYLPLAHVLERLLQIAVLQEGGRIGFYQGSTLTITDDMKALRPTIFTSVPRLLNKVYQKITEKINSTGGITKFLFYRGLEAKKAAMKKGSNSHWFYDRLVFSKIAANVGLDETQLTISGSAPLSTEVLDFLRCILGNVVVEGYGATESSAATFLQLPHDFTSGHVGGPMACCEMRLEDVNEMAYLHTDREHNGMDCIARGELCLRGYNICSGYFRHPEMTKEAYDEDGFFHTGDIAMVFPNGATKVID